MRKLFLIFGAFMLIACPSFGQMSPQQRDSLNKLTQADHQLMMQKLGIESLRPGPSGNPEAPNAVNSDESKAVQYESVPDPLVFFNGKPVLNKTDWENRRLELMELFDREMYGRMPKNLPEVKWELVWEKDTLIGGIEVAYKKMKGMVDNSEYPWSSKKCG
jgi:hypothetical protein